MAKILVIDDSSYIQIELVDLLSGEGFEVLTASSGPEGIDKFNENTDVKLLISDINMPGMDGFEMISRIRETPHGKNALILMLTTEASVEAKDKGKKLGVKGWLVKPVKPQILVEGVKQMIKKLEAA